MLRRLSASAAILMTISNCHCGYSLETDTMICRNGIVSKGDTIPVVVNKRGPPSVADRHSGDRTGLLFVIIITVDDCIYDFGPNVFMYGIRFENRRVNKIECLDYGY